MDEDEIQNEVRVVESILRGESHPNIICILQHGKISSPGLLCYFIDMELCEQTLDEYIHKERLTELALETSQGNDRNSAETVYAAKNGTPLANIRNIWVIMGQIAGGLEFMHKNQQVHRDLKPRNVLYSRRTNTWKIADFGTTVEGTSRQAHTTKYSRGTASYRAPEIISERGQYTNKVDLWALGCILFEIACSQRAFTGDGHVLEYKQDPSRFPLLPRISEWPVKLEPHLLEFVRTLLDINPKNRPRASLAHSFFASYRTLLNEDLVKTIDDLELIPSYVDWINMVRDHPTDTSLRQGLGRLYASRGNEKAVLTLLTGLVPHNQDEWKFEIELALTVERMGGGDAAFPMWKRIIILHPYKWDLIKELAPMLEMKEDEDATITLWKVLEGRNIATFTDSKYMCELATEYEKSGDIDAAFSVWKRLAHRYPDRLKFALKVEEMKKETIRMNLRRLKEINKDAIVTATNILDTKPDEWEYQYELAKAYARNRNWEAAVEGWQCLVDKYPYVRGIRERLIEAREKAGKTTRSDWEELATRYPNEWGLVGRLQSGSIDETTITDSGFANGSNGLLGGAISQLFDTMRVALPFKRQSKSS